MANYKVAIPYYATVYIDVVADTKEEAEEIAIQEAWPSLCYHCSKEVEMGEMGEMDEISTIEVYEGE